MRGSARVTLVCPPHGIFCTGMGESNGQPTRSLTAITKRSKNLIQLVVLFEGVAKKHVAQNTFENNLMCSKKS